ncbi:hypothetical protein [Bacteroides congonensis]|uniref:hypothetical protein n=1 Tax=Bacteroides congonensis TaxID=1871006 RepID=UPI0023F9231D|nr:hypothetical protein [Bacteroides congonensis]
MNIDDTLTQAFADLKIVGRIRMENLLNNSKVESNMKLYSDTLEETLHNLRTPNEIYLTLIVCNGNATPKGYFDLKKYNQSKKEHE